MKNAAHIIFIFLLQVVMTSCEKDSGPYITEIESGGGSNNDTTLIPPIVPEPTVFSYVISYGTHLKPILEQNCVKACHNPKHPKLDLRAQVSYNQLLSDGFSAPYVNVASPVQSILYMHLAGIYTLMPEGGPQLSQGKIDSVYTWINQGALDN